jgi:hypothetical protein
MKKIILFSSFIMLLLSACDSSNQYDVYVKNATCETIKVVFKSPTDRNNTSEQELLLEPGDYQRIISTENIEKQKDKSETDQACQQVAVYVKAFQNEKSSTLQWCDEAIQYSTVDIGQGEFFIEYTSEHF